MIFDCLFFPVEGGPFEDKFIMNRILFRTSKGSYELTYYLKQVSEASFSFKKQTNKRK